MNNTESKNSVDFSNIRNIQNLLKSNGISNLNAGVNSFKQRLNELGAKILELKQNTKAETKIEKPVEAEVKKAEQTNSLPNVPVTKTQPKPVERRTERQESSKFQPSNGNSRNFNNQNQNRSNPFGSRQNFQGQGQNQKNGNNFSSRPQGRFTPTGERRFDNSERKPGGYTAGSGNFRQGMRPNGSSAGTGFQRKPFNQNQTSTGFGPRLARPTESFDASSLAKNNRNIAPKKKSYEKSGDEKKSSFSKKAMLMRG